MSKFKELAQELMEAARDAGADDALAEVVESTTTQVRYSNKLIDATNWWSERSAMMFVSVGKRTFASDLRDLNEAKSLVPALVAAAKASPPNESYAGIASGRFKYGPVKVDRKIVNLRDPSRYVHEAIAAAESEGAVDVGGTLFVRHRKTALSSSEGHSAEDESAAMELSVRAFSQPEASGHSVCIVPRLAMLKARDTGRRAGELARLARNPVSGDEGKFDVIMEPLYLGDLIRPTSDMLSAKMVEIGLSAFAKKIGKPVASSDVTLADDPLIESSSRRLFDHEGVPTRRNVLIKDGVLKTFVHNTSTAKRFKTKTTASAGPMIPTTFAMAAQPLLFHPVVSPGDWTRDEIFEDTRNGLYVNNGWYIRFQNYSTGDFSNIPRDAILRVVDGEVVGPVKNIRVSDNLLNMWKSVDAVSKDPQEIYWWDEAAPPSTLPMVRARAMNITRSS